MVRPLPQVLRRSGLRALALAALALAGLGAVAASAPEGAASPAAATAGRPPARWVRVSVATLWVRPGEARRVDAPALAVPADPRAWLDGLTTTQERWLVGRLETQALYGAKVYLLGASGSWSRVAVAGQPTPRNAWGYPGWLPTRQLTATEPAAATNVALVRWPALWLYGDQGLSGRVLEVSCATRLPVVSATSESVEVVQVNGAHAFVRRAGVVLHEAGAAWPAPTGAQVVSQARRFLGLQYLWAGTSGFCLDCSGFTHLVYKAVGVTIPRDASTQSTAGRRVATRSALRAGDLVFFRSASGAIHHVGLYVGDGRMIHAPNTGSSVRIVSLGTEPYRSEFAGGRRFTP
jgi:cell wall-associated NlpC family hydrolase